MSEKLILLGNTELKMDDVNDRMCAQFFKNVNGAFGFIGNEDKLADVHRQGIEEGSPQKGMMYASLLKAKSEMNGEGSPQDLAEKAAEIYSHDFPDGERYAISEYYTRVGDADQSGMPSKVSVEDMMALGSENSDEFDNFPMATKNKAEATQPLPEEQKKPPSIVGSLIRGLGAVAKAGLALVGAVNTSQTSPQSPNNKPPRQSNKQEIPTTAYDPKGVERTYQELYQDLLGAKNLGTLALGNDKNQFLQSRLDTVAYANEYGTPEQQLQAKTNAIAAFSLAHQSGTAKNLSPNVMSGLVGVAGSLGMEDAQQGLGKSDLRTLNMMHNSIRENGGHVAGDPTLDQQQQQEVSIPEYANEANQYAATFASVER